MSEEKGEEDMSKGSSVARHAYMLKKKHGNKYKIIEAAVRSYEATCEDMWNDLIFEMSVKTNLSQRTVERIVDSL